MNNIANEEPDEHWRMIHPEGKVVLDLGCGKFYSSISTAEWFINKGAKSVIGIDLSDIKFHNDKFIMHVMRIDSTQILQDLIDNYKPELIKCDIEGAEIYLDGIKSIPSTEFAIEYHDENTKIISEKVIKRWGFENIEYYTLLNIDINRIGVIYAWK
jgi:hypothetical protein